MIWFALVIPAVFVTVLSIKFNKIEHIYVYIGSLLTSSAVIAFCVGSSLESQIRDTEYWGGWVVKAVHEERWDEYIHETCSRTVSCGKDCAKTEWYDCSYVKDHPEKWWCLDSNGYEFIISKRDYDNIRLRFRNNAKTGHHRGYYVSGDIFSTIYNGQDDLRLPTTIKHTYKNKVQASHNVMNFPEVTTEEAKKLGLYDYPEEDIFNTPSVLGCNNNEWQMAVNLFNSKYGAIKQIRVWVLLYENKPQGIVQDQINYWKNGNKNELVICIGHDGKKIKWSQVFSWSRSDELMIKIRDRIIAKKELDIAALVRWMEPHILSDWKRREFSEFDYLSIENGTISIISANILCLIISITTVFMSIKLENT